MTSIAKRKTGPKINHKFEEAVTSFLVLKVPTTTTTTAITTTIITTHNTIMYKVMDSTDKVPIGERRVNLIHRIINLTYSYDMVRMAASDAR